MLKWVVITLFTLIILKFGFNFFSLFLMFMVAMTVGSILTGIDNAKASSYLASKYDSEIK